MFAVKPPVLLVKMHRSSFSFGATVYTAHEIEENLQQCPVAAEESIVIAISGDDVILLRDRGLHADGDGFLAVV